MEYNMVWVVKLLQRRYYSQEKKRKYFLTNGKLIYIVYGLVYQNNLKGNLYWKHDKAV